MMNRMTTPAKLALVCLVPLAGVAIAQDSTSRPASRPVEQEPQDANLPVLSASDTEAILEHEGKHVFVEGKVERAAWSSSGKVMNIRFAGADPDDGFMAALFEKQRKNFDKAFGGDVTEALTGKTVRLEGVVSTYGGHIEALQDRPEIILNLTSQITIREGESDADAPTSRPADVTGAQPAKTDKVEETGGLEIRSE